MLLLLSALAHAGDLSLYQSALGRIDERWLWPEQIDHREMFTAAGRSLEESVGWLLVTPTATGLHLEGERWATNVAMNTDFPTALAALEDAVRTAGMPLPADVDLRVEILRGVVSTLDRHSTVLHAEGLERFDERLSGTLSGVGVTIGLADARLTVKEIFEGGPAARAGLRVGDVIFRIDGVSTIGMVPADATDRIRGVAGSHVVLSIQRGETTFDADIGREELTIPNVVASVGPDGIGVLTIDHFSEQTSQYLDAGLESLQASGNAQAGVIIDLRGNTGGSLIQSAKAVDTFVSEGMIVTTEGRGRNRVPGLLHDMEARPEYPAWNMPIAVLIDHSSASGSEILAGALSKLSRAILVGETSYGKGTVQSIYPLDPAIKLKLTVAQYVLTGDTHVHGVGLTPDVEVTPVRFNESGVWYPDPARARSAAVRIPRVEESSGWRAAPPALRPDDTLAVAAAILRGTQGSTRDDAIVSARRLASSLISAANQDLESMFAVRDIDWSMADAPALNAAVEADLSVPEAILPGQANEIRVAVHNRGGPLHRAAVRLHSINPALDDLVLAIGTIESGATGVGIAKFHPDARDSGRADIVTGTLEADQMTAFDVVDRVVSVAATPTPTFTVDARIAGAGDGTRVALDVHNAGTQAILGLHLQFAFPSQAGLSLALPVESTVTIEPRHTAHLELGLAISDTWASKTVPLTLDIDAPGWPRLATWALDLRRDGRAAHLQAPLITVAEVAPLTSVGPALLSFHVSDDGPLANISVTAGKEGVDRSKWEPLWTHDGHKVAAMAGNGRRLTASVPVDVLPGTNRWVIVAEDRDGLRTVREVYRLGVPAAETTADGELPPRTGPAP